MAKRLVWMITPETPDEFFDLLESAGMDVAAANKVIFEAADRGWVEVFGCTEQDPKDITSVLQERLDAKVIYVNPGEDKHV